MKIAIKTAVFLILLVLFSAASNALPENYGISVFEQKIGARAFGMGGSFSYLGGDKSLSFSNPAGLLGSQGVFVTVQGSSLGVAQIFSVGKGTAGIGLVARNLRDIPVGGSIYSYSNEYAMLMYAQKIYKFILGANLKFILNQEVRAGGTSLSGSGWDADLGILAFPLPWLKVGALVQNLMPAGLLGGGSNNWSNNTTEGIPSAVRLGSGIKIFGDDSLLIGFDAEMDVKGSRPGMLHLGLEWKQADDLFAVRAGLDQQMKNNAVENIMTFGIGTVIETWNMDAFYNSGNSGSTSGLSALYILSEDLEKKGENVHTLKVISPDDNITTTDEKIIINGEAIGLNVKINNLDVYVNPDGKYAAEVPLYVGKNLIQVTGKYEDSEIVIKRHILRNAKVVVKEEGVLEKEKRRIKKEREKILQKELSLASREAMPSLSAKEMEAIEKDRKIIEAEKARLEQSAAKIEVRTKTVTTQKEKVEALATLGVIKVEPKKEYETGEKISRAELAMWLVKARGLHVSAVKKDLFIDVPSKHWAAPYIQAAVRGGLMKAYSDGKFRPDEGVGPTEAIDILKRFDELK